MTKVFIDANVFFAASCSLTGGSALIIELGKRGKIKLVSSRLAVKEAERNLREKSSERELDRFYRTFDEIKIDLVDVPKIIAKEKFADIVGEKDAPILASAIFAKAKFLITLDSKHFLNEKVRSAKLPIGIVTPGEFIEEI